MKAEKMLERITLDPNVMTGKPVIRGNKTYGAVYPGMVSTWRFCGGDPLRVQRIKRR